MKRSNHGVMLTAILLATVPVVSIGADHLDSSLNEPVEITRLKAAWRAMGNERVRFPLDMQDIAVRIGPERQLFVDASREVWTKYAPIFGEELLDAARGANE